MIDTLSRGPAITHPIVTLALAIVLNAGANILIKVGMLRTGETKGFSELVKKAMVQPALWLGIVFFALALAAYSMVLSRLALSIAYPIMVSMGLVIVVLVSGLVLKEAITPLQIAGFALIIAGVWMVAR